MPDPNKSPFKVTLGMLMPLVKPVLRGMQVKFDAERKVIIISQKQLSREIPFNDVEAFINGGKY
ncbi:MAG: hypothetical protein WC374_01060 [Phycisphaerae bacterium]|jgi:hypothetical protein